jgi:hypothetical protein
MNDFKWDGIYARLLSAACVVCLSFTGHKLYSFAEHGNYEKYNPEL